MAKKAKTPAASKKQKPKPSSKLTSKPTSKATSKAMPAPVKKAVSSKNAQQSQSSAGNKKAEAPTKTLQVKKVDLDEKPPSAKVASVSQKTELLAKSEILPPLAAVEKTEKSPLVKKTKVSRAAEAKEKAAKQATSDEEARWVDVYEKNKGQKPLDYDMKRKYESNTSLQHKILGWGWILSNENDRLEVLFKDGRKILISNYNS
jgi:hypothetical protein